MRLIVILGIFTLISCSEKSITVSTNLTFEGNLDKNRFENDYVTLEVKNFWVENEKRSDSTQFLILNKIGNNFKPNIIFLAINKNVYLKEFGFQNLEQYMNALTENFKSKSEFKLLSACKKTKINGRTLIYSEFILKVEDSDYLQIYYGLELEDFYLGIISTDNYLKEDPDIFAIIKTIKVK